MGILRADRVSGLGGANALNGSVFFGGPEQLTGGVTSNNILITEVSSDFTFGTGDFTIEGWFYTPDLSNWNLLLGDNVYQSTGGWSLYFNTDPDIDWWKGAASVVSGATPTVSTWHHIAFSREDGNNRVFLDGTLGATAVDSTNYTGTQILIGANQLTTAGVSQWGFKGYASNVRVIKGEAIYTAAFTPPKGRLEKTDNTNTVLLCCQSPGNVLQEATGKTLYTLNKPVASHFSPDVGEDHGTTFEDNIKFDTLSYLVPPGGTTTQSNRGRGVIGGGYTPTLVKTVQYIEIQSTGISVDFGDKTDTRYAATAVSSSTRGVMAGGHSSSSSPYPVVNTMDYITIATTSNATDFGDMLATVANRTGTCSNTRGVLVAGYSPNIRDMEYITIASTGNGTDFGDSLWGYYAMNQGGVVNSPTRGVFAGGNTNAAPTAVNSIQYITIATTGDATDFGDLSHDNGYFNVGACSETRGLFMGGSDVDSPYSTPNNIDYITIATTGNGTDFGDLTLGRYAGEGVSNGTRGVFCGGATGPAAPDGVNTIDYVTIASTGNALDFGDLFEIQRVGGGMSDSHGGIS